MIVCHLPCYLSSNFFGLTSLSESPVIDRVQYAELSLSLTLTGLSLAY